MKLFFDDVCYDIYLDDDILHNSVGMRRFYQIAVELLTDGQHLLFEQGEREFEYVENN